ncbi:MAG: hypothetical protein ACW99L_00970, partial [Promethearchaeota archaeon]
MINIMFQEPITELDVFITATIFIFLSFLILIGITFFFTSWGDKTQLLPPKLYVATIILTVAPLLIFLIFEAVRLGSDFMVAAPTYWIILAIIGFFLNFGIKRIAYRTIPY